MRTEQILYLSEIHRTSSLHRASENLHISVQSLSLSINTLEKEFGLSKEQTWCESVLPCQKCVLRGTKRKNGKYNKE